MKALYVSHASSYILLLLGLFSDLSLATGGQVADAFASLMQVRR
jgi:hypothetical protein